MTLTNDSQQIMKPEWSGGQCFIHGHAETLITGSCHQPPSFCHPRLFWAWGWARLLVVQVSLPAWGGGACPGSEGQARNLRSIPAEHLGKPRLRCSGVIRLPHWGGRGSHPPTSPETEAYGGPRVPGEAQVAW